MTSPNLLPLTPAPSRSASVLRSPPPGAGAVVLRPLEARTLLRRARGASGSGPCARADFTINPYRGCEIGCIYCHARFSHDLIELGNWRDFEQKIFFKTNAGEILARELSRAAAANPALNGRPLEGAGGGKLPRSVAVGTVTDPYQPAEERLGITRSVLETLLRAPAPFAVRINTKSDLVLRDLDLLRGLAARGGVRVNLTITTLDHDLAKALEPRAPGPRRRLRALAALRAAGIEAGVFLLPLIPGVNDGQDAIDALAREAKEAGALYLLEGPLLLLRSAWEPFFHFLRRQYPHLEKAYREVFEDRAGAPDHYRRKVRRRVAIARRAHGLADGPRDDGSPVRRGARGVLTPKRRERQVRQLEIPGI